MSAKIDSSTVRTETCPVCRTGHDVPICPPPPPTVSERMFTEMTTDDLYRICEEIGGEFGHSSVHCVAFYELLKRYRPENQR